MSTFTTIVKNLSLKLGHKNSKLCKEECPEEKNGILLNSGSDNLCLPITDTHPTLALQYELPVGIFL